MPDGFLFSDEADAQKACEWWQRELRLLDWRGIVRIVRKRDMKNPENDGEISRNVEWREFTIRIVDPIDLAVLDGFKNDHEELLVHELGHLHTLPISEKDTNAEEVALCSFAEALVRLRRAAYPEPPWRCDHA